MKKIPTGLSLYVYRIQYGTRNIYIIDETENTVRAVEIEKTSLIRTATAKEAQILRHYQSGGMSIYVFMFLSP